MGDRAASAIDARYRRSFGVRAGYLPEDRGVLDEWHGVLTAHERAHAAAPPSSPAVQALAELLDKDAIVRMYVTEMIEQAALLPGQSTRRDTIDSVPGLLAALDTITRTAPTYKIGFPMSALFAYMMMTTAGEAVFRNGRFNDALRAILKEWCRFLDSEASTSTLTDGEDGWLSPQAIKKLKLDDFVIPDRKAKHWGFRSWNEFFHRPIREKLRPIADPGNPKVIVSPNDGHVYSFAANVREYDTFWAKGQAYSLRDMLAGRHLDRFIQGGTGASVIQSFLSGNDLHRWGSPVDGKVVDATIVPGLMFSDAESAGFDPDAGVKSQGYEVSVNTRALVFIESPDPAIGMVCVIPIGITEVSGITLEVKPGDEVKKGQELGYFNYGGSTLCVVFQPGAVDYFTLRAPVVGDPNAGPPGSIDSQIKYRDRLAMARG